MRGKIPDFVMPTTFPLTFARFDENYLRKNENIIKFDL